MSRIEAEIAGRLARLESLKADLSRDLAWDDNPITRAAFAGVSLTLVAVEGAIERETKDIAA